MEENVAQLVSDDPRDPRWQERERRRWRSFRRGRPAQVEPAGPGRESVWDYPRPPRLEPVASELRVEFAGEVVARSRAGLRVCETASPPCYYLPPADVRLEWLVPSQQRSFCEWKGLASYFDLRIGDRRARDCAWTYRQPASPFEPLRDHVAFYPGRVDACWVGEQRVTPQPGRFYAGWITPELVGPFKGEPGTEHW